MSLRISFLLAGIFGFLAVALGAFGAHFLHARLTAAGTLSLWDKAVLYQMVHASLIFGSTLTAQRSMEAVAARWLKRAATFWSFGIILFSGSLYALALGAPHRVGIVTPFGGLSLLIGWLCVVLFSRQCSPGMQRDNHG